jgi:hypothetical protein
MNLENDQPQSDNLLVYIAFNSPSYLDLFNQLIIDHAKKKKNIFLLNPPSYTDIQHGFGKLLVSLFRLTSPYTSWLNEIKENDKVVVYSFKDFNASTNELFLESKWNELASSQEFLQSLQSTLISEFKSSNPELEFNYKKKKTEITNFAKKIFIQTSNVLNTNTSINHLLVPNGRFLDQFVFSQTPRFLGKNHIKINYYERGLEPNSYYAGEISLLDRVKIQELISRKEIKMEVADWFLNRITEPSANEYSGLWNSNELKYKHNKSVEAPTITIFTSSPDEFAFLGPDWHESEWKDQWEAYNAVIYRFAKTHSIIIRLHPNTISKSYMERKRIKRSVKNIEEKYPHVKVIPASSSINSYSLIRESAIVVTWYSTVGLEAVNMGVPVICLNSSEWDLVADVNRVFSIKSLEAILLPLKAPDKFTATRFICGRIALDLPVHTNTHNELSRKVGLSHRSINQKISENMRGSIDLKPRHVLMAMYQCVIWSIFVKFLPRNLKKTSKSTYKKVKARLIDSRIV